MRPLSSPGGAARSIFVCLLLLMCLPWAAGAQVLPDVIGGDATVGAPLPDPSAGPTGTVHVLDESSAPLHLEGESSTRQGVFVDLPEAQGLPIRRVGIESAYLGDTVPWAHDDGDLLGHHRFEVHPGAIDAELRALDNALAQNSVNRPIPGADDLMPGGARPRPEAGGSGLAPASPDGLRDPDTAPPSTEEVVELGKEAWAAFQAARADGGLAGWFAALGACLFLVIAVLKRFGRLALTGRQIRLAMLVIGAGAALVTEIALGGGWVNELLAFVLTGPLAILLDQLGVKVIRDPGGRPAGAQPALATATLTAADVVMDPDRLADKLAERMTSGAYAEKLRGPAGPPGPQGPAGLDGSSGPAGMGSHGSLIPPSRGGPGHRGA